MAKLVHLKKQDGSSFYVTPHAFETSIKTEKNWRKKYDYVGEVDEEEVGAKSESAQLAKTETATYDGKQKVKSTDTEEGNEDIFSSDKGGNSSIEKFEAHMEKSMELSQEGKFEEARDEVKKALILSPTSKICGKTIEHLNGLIERKAVEEKEKEENAKQVKRFIKEARDLVAKKKFTKAKTEVEAALALSPEDEEATQLLAEIEKSIK